MTITLFAAALLAAAPPDAPSGEPPVTAGQLYEACVRYVANAGKPPEGHDDSEISCAVQVALVLVIDAADAALRETEPARADAREFCLPASVSQTIDTGPRLARAFIDHVDRNPASRSADADETFRHALAEKWPCPR